MEEEESDEKAKRARSSDLVTNQQGEPFTLRDGSLVHINLANDKMDFPKLNLRLLQFKKVIFSECFLLVLFFFYCTFLKTIK